MMNNLKKIEGQNIIAWIIANDIRTERGVPFDWQKFSFMIDPYLDWTPLQGTRKCTQIGWSVMTNIKLFYAAKFGIPGYGVPAANVIYTLPTDADVNAFVPSKTNLIIANNKTISDYMLDDHGNKREANSIQRKQIGNSMVYFKGTRSKTAALMLTSDLNIHDESDRSSSDIIDQYESRLDNSIYKGRWIFSNPSAPNMPADLLYQQSDQKHWFIKCERCGHWQYLEWAKLSEFEFKKANHCYVDDTNMCYVCSKCAMPITDGNRQRGRWVAKTKSDISGYWVSHMMCSWKSVKELHRMEVGPKGDGIGAKTKSYFMNFVRGLPYIGSDIVVDESTIVNNMVLDKIEWVRGEVVLGVDNGDTKWWVIGDKRGIFGYGSTKSWDDIEKLIAKFDPYTVIDMNPYPNKPRELAKQHRKVWASFYVDDKRTLELVDWGKLGSDKAFMVYPNRERIIDALVDYIHHGNVKFYGPKSYWEPYIKHWETMYQAKMIGSKVIVGDIPKGEEGLKEVRATWLSSTGKDHWVHATVYWYTALQKLMTGHGQVLGGGAAIKDVVKSVGGVMTAPVVENGEMKQHRSFIPDLTKKKPKRGGSVSGNM